MGALENRMEKLSKADLASIDLWTACPMTFHAGMGEFIIIPRYTPCHKPKYTEKMRSELNALTRGQAYPLDDGDFLVFVDLVGLRRTIRRSNLYTRSQYDDAREKDRAALGALRAKSRRAVGEGGEAVGCDSSVVAAEDGD